MSRRPRLLTLLLGVLAAFCIFNLLLSVLVVFKENGRFPIVSHEFIELDITEPTAALPNRLGNQQSKPVDTATASRLDPKDRNKELITL